MLAKKCDACGNLYESYGKATNDAKDANGLQFIAVKTNGVDYYSCGIKDLCPECMDAVKSLLRDRGMEV